MNLGINEQTIAIGMLNGLPERLDPLISSPDALRDEKNLTREFLKVTFFRESKEIKNVLKAQSRN